MYFKGRNLTVKIIMKSRKIAMRKTKRITSNFFRKNAWISILLILSVTGVTLGVCGFYAQGNNFPESLYKTLQLFALNVLFGDGSITISPLLQWSRWLIFAATLWATYRLFIEILAPKWWQTQKQYFLCSKRYLFVGASEQARILAKNLKENDCRCIFLVSKGKENDNALFDELRDMGAIVLYANFEDETMKFPQKTGDKFFFVEDDEDFNMEMSVRLLNQLKENAHIYIRTESREFYSYIKQYISAEIYVFNQSDLTAGLFVKKYPMLDSPNVKIDHEKLHVKGEFNVLFLGFGWQGKELLKKCVCDSQFVGSTFRATIIDKDFEKFHGDYLMLFDECIKHYNLQFKSESVGSVAFYEWLNIEISNFNRIITLGNDSINMDTAEKIAKFLYKKGIYDTQEIVFARVQKLNPYSEVFTAFGNIKDVYTGKVIVNEEDDEIAKMVNYVYSRYDKPFFDEFTKEDRENIVIKWKEASLFDKDSSRAVARNIDNIMRILDKKNILKLNKDEMEIIAENEHLRWNAFHFVNGICKWEPDEIYNDNAKLSDKSKNLLKHGCLTSFSELDRISKKVQDLGNKNENYAESDRRIVRHFPLFKKEVEELKNRKQ